MFEYAAFSFATITTGPRLYLGIASAPVLLKILPLHGKVKRILTTVLLLFAAPALLNQQTADGQNCTPVRPDLVSWWTADGHALDSRSRNNGTLMNGATFAAGQNGQGFSFDGVDDFVRVPDNDNLSPAVAQTQGAEGEITVSAWVNVPALFVSGQQTIIAKGGDGGPPAEYEYELQVGPNGSVAFSAYGILGGNAAFVVGTPPGGFSVNQWHLITGTLKNLQFIRIYFDGNLIGESTTFSSSQVLSNTSSSLFIGQRGEGIKNFNGLIDEAQIYRRALSGSEILTTFNAGSAGNCKPTATQAPTGLISWWAGDASFNDIQGNNSPSQLNGSPQFNVAKVSQGMRFDGNSGLVVSDNATLNFGTGSFSLEMWTRIDTLPGANGAVVFEKRNNAAQGYVLSMDSTGFFFTVRGSGGAVTISAPVSVGGFHHLAIAVDRVTNNNVTFYLDGVVQSVSPSIVGIGNTDNTGDLFIGQNSTQSGTTAGAFNGVLDEVSLYNRALTPVEITSIFNAGLAGKLKTATTPTGSNVSTNVGSDATITFTNVATAGTTQQIPLDPAVLPAPPAGFSSVGLAYDIATGASISGSTNVCFNLRGLDIVTFLKSRVFHEEGGVWVNRTSSIDSPTKTLCASVSSLSPFLIAQNPSFPTAASSSISGKVTTAGGSPVAGAVIKLSGQQAAITITDSGGNYQFDNVETNHFYSLTPTLANYQFTPSSRSFSLIGNKTDAVFTANAVAVASANAIDTSEFFVRQQYLDFLGREPDQGGFEYWSARINQCNDNPVCIHLQRIDVSAAFFIEAEFQLTGSFVYNLYQGALDRRPQFVEYMTDRQQVVAGANLEAKKQAFAESFVQRAEFANRYQTSVSAESFVDALIVNIAQTSGVDLSSARATLISRYNSGTSQTNSRSLVLRDMTENAAVREANYNAAFVLTEYFGYLRRNPDEAGYTFWLNVLNNGDRNNYRGMVCSFITSTEYQRRFSTVVTHSNSDCGQ